MIGPLMYAALGSRPDRKVESGKVGGGSETSRSTGGAARRYGTSPLLQMWEGQYRLRKTRGARCLSGSSRSARRGNRSGGRRRRSWVPRENWVLGRNYRCSYPRHLSSHPQMRIRGGDTIPVVLSFVRILLLCNLFSALYIFLGQA